MRSGRLLALALVVIAVGAFIFIYERHLPTSEQVKERADKVLANLKQDDVVGLDITNSHGSFQLEKKDDHWSLLKPIEAAADDSAVGSLLTALTNLKVERALAPGVVKPAEYELDKPEMSVVIKAKDGSTARLDVGGKTALGSNRAVSIGDGRILLCSGYFTSDLDKDLGAWRSHRVVNLFSDQVASLEVKRPTGGVQAVRKGEHWELLEPVKDLADRDQIRNVISDLNEIRVQQFLDTGSDLAKLGLDHPRYDVTLVRTDGEGAVELAFGKVKEVDGKKRVACRRDGKDLFWVSDQAEVGLGKAPVLWRSKKVYPFDAWDVKEALFVSGKKKVDLKFEDGKWKLADGKDANSTAALGRLSKLSGLEAEAFDLVKPAMAERGHITLTLSAGSDEAKDEKNAKTQQVTYTFYPPLAAGGRALVAVDARPTVMSVEEFKVGQLLGNLDELSTLPTPTPVATATPVPTK
ncbi:MAG: DUF4340 domain-containing protein [Acidobacteria bacterium]|nr:DUF4340 domain-containing protein [Acidobacteriota bacterium]